MGMGMRMRMGMGMGMGMRMRMCMFSKLLNSMQLSWPNVFDQILTCKVCDKGLGEEKCATCKVCDM